MRGVLFRLNAGTKIGFGHLSRCLCIANKLPDNINISFIIYSDNQWSVLSFLEHRGKNLNIKDVIFLHDNEYKTDIQAVLNYVMCNNCFLILDHYDVDEDYQLSLFSSGVRWLQLDSMAKQKFYANYVQHGSPGATRELYANLHGNETTKFLLGPKYVIVDEKFTKLHSEAKIRNQVHTIFLSFGGGTAKGALLKYLNSLAIQFSTIDFVVVLRSILPNLEIIKEIARRNQNIKLYIDVNTNNVADLMSLSDLAILAPGGMSYEAATLGLPLILIATEENQYINLNGCRNLGIAVSLGCIEQVSPALLCQTIGELTCNSVKIQSMSLRSLAIFDGKGTERIINQIISEL